MGDFLCCAIPLVVLLGGTALLVLFWRRLATRGYETSMDMDGATCLKAADGSLVFRRQTLKSSLYLLILGLAEVGVLAMVPATVRGLLAPETGFWEAIDNVLLLIGVAGLLGAAIYVLLRSVRLSRSSLDAGDRVLRTGRGKNRREVPFADISRVTVCAVYKGSLEEPETAALEIGVLIRDDETLGLGTVSGQTEQATDRATTIARWIVDLTGAGIEQPVAKDVVG